MAIQQVQCTRMLARDLISVLQDCKLQGIEGTIACDAYGNFCPPMDHALHFTSCSLQKHTFVLLLKEPILVK